MAREWKPNGEAKIRVTHAWNPPGKIIRDGSVPVKARITAKLVTAHNGATVLDRATGRDRSPRYGGFRDYRGTLLAYRFDRGEWISITPPES